MSESKGPEEQSAEEKAESLVRRIVNKGPEFCRALWNRKWKKALVSLVGIIVAVWGSSPAIQWWTVHTLNSTLEKAVKDIPVLWPQGKPLDLNELKRRAVIAVTTKHRKEIESEKNLEPQYLLQLGNAERSFGQTSQAKRYYKLGLERAKEAKDEKNEAAARFNLASLQLEETGKLDEALKNAGKALEIHQMEGTKEDTATDLALLGEIRSKKGEYRQAISIFKQASEKYREAGEFDRVVDMQSAIGEAYLGAGNFDSALDELKTASKRREADKDKKGLAKDLFLIGTIYRSQGKRELALQYFRKARKIFAEQHSKEEGKALFHMGRIYLDMGDPHQALDALKNSARLLKDAELEALSNYHIGLILNEQGSSEAGLVLMQKALQTSRENDKGELEAQSLHHIGVTQRKMGRFHQALESFDQARSVHNRLDDKRGEALDLFESGIVLRHMGKYYEAAGRFQAALVMFREADNGDGDAARALGHLSLISMDEGNYEQALRRGWKAYKIHEAMSKWKDAADRMLELALVYRAKGELDLAQDRVRCAQRLYKGYQADQDEEWQARYHRVRGLILKDRGELVEAAGDLALAYEIFQRKTGHLREEADVQAALAVIRHELGEFFRPPLGELRAALQSYREIGYPKGEATTHGYMGRVLFDHGQPDEALKHSHKALGLFKRLKSQKGTAEMYEQIGLIHLKSRHAGDAERSFRKAQAIHQGRGDCGKEACSLAYLGIATFLGGREEEARGHWTRGNELGKRVRCDMSRALNLACLGGAPASDGDETEALQRLREAAKLGRNNSVGRRRLEFVGMMWNTEAKQGEERRQSRLCEMARKFYEEVKDQKDWREFAEKLTTVCRPVSAHLPE